VPNANATVAMTAANVFAIARAHVKKSTTAKAATAVAAAFSSSCRTGSKSGAAMSTGRPAMRRAASKAA